MGAIELDHLVVPDHGLLDILSLSSHTFLQPPHSLHTATLAHAKRYIDPIATATSQIQEKRQQAFNKKRKRGQPSEYDGQGVLRLKQLYLDGFSIDQVWEQAKRALDANRFEVEKSLRAIQPEIASLQSSTKASQPSSKVVNGGERKKSVRFRDIDEAEDEDDSTDDENVVSREYGAEGKNELPEEYGDREALESSDEINVDEELGYESLSNPDDAPNGENNDGYDGVDMDELESLEEEPSNVFVQDKNGLNDGFFSIDDFNKQADFLEQRDARGQDDGAASDEEDVDWDADPLVEGAASSLIKDQDHNETRESESDEQGPTFDDAADNESITDIDDASDPDLHLGESGAMSNTNSIRYAEFFEPPARKANKGKKSRHSHPKDSLPTGSKEDEEADMQRTMAAVRRDIFEDDLTPDEDEAPSDPEDRRSSHQKRQAALTAEIRRLEAAAIQKRDWTLSGEARAADRPLNSLLEEDLDFERVGKPVPVITQEVSEDIEALIKRRILAREFDEVVRRRPDNLATGGGNKDGQRRGIFELSNAKPEQSLAEVYENEHLQRSDPAAHPSKADKKLKAEQDKIEALWKDVSAKLDALSSWYYRPKPPSAEVTVVSDVPAVSMEDARPAGVSGDVGVESMLAPQEIYKAGEARDKAREVTTGGGLPVGRAEMTREEKLRRRRREKERIRKSGEGVGALKGKAEGKKAEEKRGVVKDLAKGGVKIIGKKGEIKDVHGNAISNRETGRGAEGLKL